MSIRCANKGDTERLPPKTEDAIFMNLSHVPVPYAVFKFADDDDHVEVEFHGEDSIPPHEHRWQKLPEKITATELTCFAVIEGYGEYEWEFDDAALEDAADYVCSAIFGVLTTVVDTERGDKAVEVIAFGEAILASGTYVTLR